MKIKLEFIKGRKILFYLVIVLYLLATTLFIFERYHNRERESIDRRLREFYNLAGQYRSIKQSGITYIGSVKNSEGLPQRINNLIDSIGLRDRVKSIRMTESREFKELIEEGAEMRIDKLTMNEMINFLHRIDNQHLSIKDVRMKKNFESPDRINLEVKVFMYRSK